MMNMSKFALNRIISPNLTLNDFIQFAKRLGISKIELRNDLPGKDKHDGILDGMNVSDFKNILNQEGVEIISINALGQFNVKSILKDKIEELKKILDIAAEIGCQAIVLCPLNSADDTRSEYQRYLETVDTLRAFGPIFSEYNIFGYIEPLGFEISSLRSIIPAMNAIKESGFGCYKTVYDTFHHYIGPDDDSIFGMNGLGSAYEVAYTGLVHISGMEISLHKNEYRDEHRILINNNDVIGNKYQIKKLESLGYLGHYSFEPFSSSVQNMDVSTLEKEIKESLSYLLDI